MQIECVSTTFIVESHFFCHDLSPLILLASCISLGIMVTLFPCMAQRLVSSNTPTRYASAASYRARTADD